MSRSSLNSRLTRMERERALAKPDAFFLVWASGDKESAIAAAKKAGAVCRGDTVVTLPWPHHSKPPAPRWTTKKGLSADEKTALHAHLQALAGPKESRTPHDHNGTLREFTDTQLLKIAAGMTIA